MKSRKGKKLGSRSKPNKRYPKDAKQFKATLETISSYTSKPVRVKKKKTPELFFDLKGKIPVNKLAKLTGKSTRTIASYYKFLSGQAMDRNDRKPSQEFLNKVDKVVRKINKKLPRKEKIKLVKPELFFITPQTDTVKQSYFITRNAKKKLQADLLEAKDRFSYIIMRAKVRYFTKRGDITEHYVSTVYRSLDNPNVNDAMNQFQAFLGVLIDDASSHSNYTKLQVIKAEILEMTFEVVAQTKAYQEKYHKKK